jgi:hypothetical protein
MSTPFQIIFYAVIIATTLMCLLVLLYIHWFTTDKKTRAKISSEKNHFDVQPGTENNALPIVVITYNPALRIAQISLKNITVTDAKNLIEKDILPEFIKKSALDKLYTIGKN